MRRILTVAFLLGLVTSFFGASASAAGGSNCNIPRGGDADGNGIGDVGVQVVCNYTSYYAYDASGAFYWDLGDGRIQSSAGISSSADLDQSTLTECFYQVHTRGSFNNDPFQDTGEISNRINCRGFDGTSAYNYLIVAPDDPRYSGDPAFAIWGTWEYHVLTQSGDGNLVHTLTNPSN